MDVLPSGGIFRELQAVHDTGYFSGQASLEEDWQQLPAPSSVAHTYSMAKPAWR